MNLKKIGLSGLTSTMLLASLSSVFTTGVQADTADNGETQSLNVVIPKITIFKIINPLKLTLN